MDQIWLHLFSLSGLLSVSLCKPQEFILVRELMTWADAQQYCRTNHLDLATLQTDEDWDSLRDEAADNAFYAFAWSGLYNDINSWRWSYNEESLTYTNWAFNQPDNYGTGEECGTIYFDGFWYDFSCVGNRYFVCRDDSVNATQKLVLVKTALTWVEAQTYCRSKYTDLATITSMAENAQITSMLNFMMTAVWTGLYRDSWKWSDRANVSSSTQLAAQKLNGASENCAAANYYRTFEDFYCTTLLYTFCSTVRRKQQVIRVKVTSGANADDATLTQLIMHKLQERLSDQEITLSWRKQADRRVFQKMKSVKKSVSNSSAPVCVKKRSTLQ